MADDELDLNAIGENDAELFEGIKDIVEGEAGDEDHDDLEQFLNEHKLNEHLSLFRDQQIDFETLMILTETDLKSLGLPLGPFRKLIIALKKKKSELHLEVDGVEDALVLDSDIDENIISNGILVSKNSFEGDANKTEDKKKDESELPTLADEGNFRVIDESGDDSDAHSVKSEHGGKKKDDKAVEPDKNHPYVYDLLHFKLEGEMKEKVELQEPTTIDSKTCELIDEKRLKSMIKALRKEKVIAVITKHKETYEKVLTLMQISTQDVDYLVDFSKMNHQILLMTDIFTNPNIVKVFYDAKYEVKCLQRYYNLFTINAYCVRSAVKELKYETSSLYALINKFVSYFKPTDSECLQRPLWNDVKINLRKETHYLLHVYYKTKNEAIEAGVFDSIVAVGTRVCGYLHVPLKERIPENLFPDYDKFNEAQKLAAEELSKWRETVAKDKNVDVNAIMTVKVLKQLCLCLPTKKEELFSIVSTRVVRVYFLKLLALLKTARKKYSSDSKDETKYDLKAIEPYKANKNKAPPKASPKPKAVGGAAGNTAPKTDLKRKSDGFVHPAPAKKRFRYRKPAFSPAKRNSLDNKGPKSPNSRSPFRNSGGYRGGYQGNNSNAGKNFQQTVVKYPNPQNIWENTQNQNFNSYGAGFKYY